MDSQPGAGTTFRIGLPLLARPDSQTPFGKLAGRQLAGSETILVVEDQDDVRKTVLSILKRYNYQTLEASSGGEALRIVESYEDPIDLMLTDVIMPERSGKESADQLRSLRPQMKVLYMSGYPADVISRQGVLDPGIEYIEKPFTPEGLAEKVRTVLDKG